MFVTVSGSSNTMAAERILIAVISGGRPLLKQRPTERLLPKLAPLGDMELVVRADQADGYEMSPGVGMNTYSVEWADRYARAHWRHPRAQFVAGGFHGAFTGREWAMKTAEERGYDAVLQLDDNITSIAPVAATKLANHPTTSVLRMYEAVRELLFSTNLMMLGIQLNSMIPKEHPTVRVGFPYSCFMEKTGPGRMPYFGPFEDDIMHAMEYGLNGGPSRTAGLVPLFTYIKESKSGTGMRKHYNAERGLELPRRYPRNARLKVTRRTSSPVEVDKGVRHLLSTRGFTPITITDKGRYLAAQQSVADQIKTGIEAINARSREKMLERAGATK